MAGTSLDSSADNPFADPSLKDNVPAPANPFSLFAEEQAADDLGKVSVASNWATEINPDALAKARTLSADALPVDTAYRQLPDLEKVKRAQALQESAQKDRSVLAYFAQKPKNLAYANPDELDNLTGLNWAYSAGVESFQSGIDQTRLGLAEYENAFGQASPELDKTIAQLDPLVNANRSFGAHDGFFTTGLPLLGQNLPQMGYSLLKGAESGIKGAVGGAITGAGTGALIGSAAGPEGTAAGALTGARTGFSIGGRVGFAYGTLNANIKLQTGLALNAFKKIKGEDGQPLDPNVMRWAALMTGIGSAGLEQTGLAATIGRIPGMDKVMGSLTIPGMSKLLKMPGMAGRLTEFVKGYAGAVTIEGVTEGMQQGLQVIAQELAKDASPGKFENITADEAAQQVLQAAGQGAQVAALLGGFTEGTRLGHELITMDRSKRNNDQLRLNLQKIDGNKFVERAPDIAAEVIDAQNPDRAVYMPADKFVELYQSQGQDPYGPPLPNWRNRLDEALQTGGDVRVSLGEFIAHFGRDPKANPLLDLVRTNPSDYVPAEIKTYSDAINELMDSELARAQQKVEVRDEVKSVVREELKKAALEAGFTNEAATHYGTVIGAYLETRAEQTGVTPEHLLQTLGPDIQGIQEDGPIVEDKSHTITNGNDIAQKPQPSHKFVALNNPESEGLDGFGPPDENGMRRRKAVPAVQIGGEIFTGHDHTAALDAAHAKFPDLTSYIDEDPQKYFGYVKEDLPVPETEHDLEVDDAEVDPGDEFYQAKKTQEPNRARGSTVFPPQGRAIIKLFNQRDMSTLLHEAGHFFLETTNTLAEQSPEIKADWDILRKKLGIGEDGKITREQHEEFARMTEAYFMQGKAPSPELRPAFQKFRQWLLSIYRQITKLGGRVDPEIAGVMDRMLVSEKRLQAVADDPAYRAMTNDTLGLDPQDYMAYQKLVEDIKSEYMDKALGRIIGQSNKLATGWFKQVENQIASEAEAYLQGQAPYKHRTTFTTQKGFKIDREAFQKKYGKEAMDKFPRTAFAKDGLDPDIAAELLDYPTGDEMVYDFVQAPPIKEAARARAKQEMIDRYGEDFSKAEVVDLVARRTMAEEGRLTVLGTEYKALSQKRGITVTDQGPKAMAKEIAIRNLYPKKVLDVNEFVSQAAVKRAGQMAEAATLKGNWAEAADWKRKQLLAQAIDNETQKLNRTVEKIREKAAKYTRTAPKGVDPSTMEQIRALVTDYEFTKVSKKKLARREALSDYLDKAEQDGLVVEVPDYLRRDAAKVNYKQLTVEQLLGFGDALDNLEHLGRLKNKLQTAKGKRDFSAVKQEILDSIRQRPEKSKKMKDYATEQRSIRDKIGDFTASWLKPEQIIEWLDAGNLEGPMAEHVFNLIADAQHKKNDMNLEYNERLMKIFEGIDPADLQEVRHIEALGKGPESNMTMEQIYAVALNMGNDQNRTKLMEGEVWNDQILQEVLGHLGKEDWDRVQKVWDAIETLWPKIAALEKRLTGVTPPRVEAREIINQHGTFRGGYYPVVYDFKAQRGLNILEDTTPADKKFMDGLVDNRFIAPGTNHKYTVARTRAAKPIKLSLSALPGHVHTVIHDLTHREAVRTAYKILWDPEIKEAVTKVESEAVHDQLQHWLRAVASERAVETDPNVQLISRLRTGMTVYSMGYRLSVAISQPLGFLTTMTRVGAKNMLPAIYQMTRHPIETMNTVTSMSGEIRHRFNTQERDIRDSINNLTKSKNPLDKVRQYAFHWIGAMDQYVATASWLGAYNEQLQKTPGNHELAVKNADRVVRLTQGTGTVKDMAKVMNNGEVLKLFTMFYSFFSAQYNMQVDLTRKTGRDIREGNWNSLFRERLPQWNYLVVMPAILGALLTGQGPGDDENKAAWALKKVLLYPLGAMPFVRDVAGTFGTPFDYKLSPVSRFGESVSKGVNKLMDGDPLGAVDPALQAIGTYFKLPLGQAVTTVEGLWDGLTRDDLKATDAIYGRRGRQ